MGLKLPGPPSPQSLLWIGISQEPIKHGLHFKALSAQSVGHLCQVGHFGPRSILRKPSLVQGWSYNPKLANPMFMWWVFVGLITHGYLMCKAPNLFEMVNPLGWLILVMVNPLWLFFWCTIPHPLSMAYAMYKYHIVCILYHIPYVFYTLCTSHIVYNIWYYMTPLYPRSPSSDELFLSILPKISWATDCQWWGHQSSLGKIVYPFLNYVGFHCWNYVDSIFCGFNYVDSRTHHPQMKHNVKYRMLLRSLSHFSSMLGIELGHRMPKELWVILGPLQILSTAYPLDTSMVDVPKSKLDHWITHIHI